MPSTDSSQQGLSGARAPLTVDELRQAVEVEVYDHAGTKIPLGDLIDGKRSVLIFTRHFCTYCHTLTILNCRELTRKGCLNCQAYVRAISDSIPPSKLPSNTQSRLRKLTTGHVTHKD